MTCHTILILRASQCCATELVFNGAHSTLGSVYRLSFSRYRVIIFDVDRITSVVSTTPVLRSTVSAP